MDPESQLVGNGTRSKRLPADIQNVAARKLAQLNAATTLDDLRVPPGNRLEALRGNRVGQYSIRVNDKYRVYFRWTATGPEDVEILDYH